MPAAAGLSDDRRVALPSRPPTQMTRHRIAQIAEKVNPKSPESRPQEGRFLQNRLLHPPHSPAQCQPVSRSSRWTVQTWTAGSRPAAGLMWDFPSARGGEDAAADLVALDRFEERAEISFAKALIALALDDLEKDRADHRLGEDLQ